MEPMKEHENSSLPPLRPLESNVGGAAAGAAIQVEASAISESGEVAVASRPCLSSRRSASPKWLETLCFLSLMLMCNQLRLSNVGAMSRICLSDIGFLVGFLPFCLYILSHGACKVRISLLCILPVMGMCIANGLSGSGLGSLVDTVQVAMQLMGGVVMFSFMLETMPQLTLVGLVAGVLLNLGVAAWQGWTYGCYLTLAPKIVIEGGWGMGGAMTGLFRSKIALSVYLGSALCLIVPQVFSRPVPRLLCRMVRLACMSLFIGAVLYFIPHGLFAALVAAIVLVAGFGVSRMSGVSVALGLAIAVIVGVCVPRFQHLTAWERTVSPLKGYDYVENADVLFGHTEPVEAEEDSVRSGELKSCHYDFVAALRLCFENPLYGVGSGNYQKYIGGAYSLNERMRFGQLPTSRINDIETDSQAGWGILAATLGVPATLLFLLLFFGLLGTNLRHLKDGDETMPGLHLGAASAVAFLICCMFLTDPFIRGIGWFMSIAFAAAESGLAARADCPCCSINVFDRKRLLALAGIMVVFLGFIPVGAKKICTMEKGCASVQAAGKCSRGTMAFDPEPPVDGQDGSVPSVGAAPGGGVAQDAPPAQPAADKALDSQQPKAPETPAAVSPSSGDDSHVLTAEEGDELYLVFNADKAVRVTLPMRLEQDASGTYPQGVLVIPDKSGVPPEGKEPALEHGGALFEFIVKQETTACVWCSVMWDGSCGNTLNVKLDDEAQSYTVGNDGTYNAWHWQKSPKSYKLKPGRHKLFVLNREDGVKLSQVLLTNDQESIPEGVEGE